MKPEIKIEMKPSEKKAITKYIKGGGMTSLDAVNRAVQMRYYDDVDRLKYVYRLSINTVIEHGKPTGDPAKCLQEIERLFVKENLNAKQKSFIIESICQHLSQLEFRLTDKTDMGTVRDIWDLLKSQVIAYSKELPLTINLREMLKDIVQMELKQLPETIKELDPSQRINVLCRLIPYILPKTESVEYNLGEPELPVSRYT